MMLARRFSIVFRLLCFHVELHLMHGLDRLSHEAPKSKQLGMLRDFVVFYRGMRANEIYAISSW